MGIDVHAINFLKLAAKERPLGDVATMGRQGLHVSEHKLREMGYNRGFGTFCEQFLIDNFGASSVESFDYSDFEQATHIADLNKPIETDKKYDTVIDAGTLEHVFNVVQALKSVSQICKVGGRILHLLPANNLANHGFWQFSPELFFSLYSSQNGYSNTRVFLSDVGEPDYWYEAKPPRNGHWDYFASHGAMYALSITTKVREVDAWEVQQSQYVADWQENQAPPQPNRLKEALKATPLFRPARALSRRLRDPDRLLKGNAHLKRFEVSKL